VTRTLIYAGGMFLGTMSLVSWFDDFRLPRSAEDLIRTAVIAQAGFGVGMMALLTHKVGTLNLHESTAKLGSSLRLIAVAFFGYALYVGFDLMERIRDHASLTWRTPLAATVVTLILIGLVKLNKHIGPIVRAAHAADATVAVKVQDTSKPGPDVDLTPPLP
jgi:hypothetical protein